MLFRRTWAYNVCLEGCPIFRLIPGFYAYGDDSGAPIDVSENVLRAAIEKRFATVETQRTIASLTSAFAASAVSDKLPSFGRSAVFAITSFLKTLPVRGKSVPRLARWALKVFDGALRLELPLNHPAAVLVVGEG